MRQPLGLLHEELEIICGMTLEELQQRYNSDDPGIHHICMNGLYLYVFLHHGLDFPHDTKQLEFLSKENNAEIGGNLWGQGVMLYKLNTQHHFTQEFSKDEAPSENTIYNFV